MPETREIIETPQGLRFPRTEVLTPGLEKRLRAGSYEAREAEAVGRLVRRGDRVLELGGGIGFMSTLMATRRPLEALETFEANPRLLPYIRQVHALNAAAPAEAVNAVLSTGATGSVPFYLRGNLLASSLDRGVDEDQITETCEVPQQPISEVIARLRPTFLVCDIEGAEAQLLPAADLSGLRAAVIELHPQWIGQPGVQAVFDAMARAGLSYFPRVSQGKVVSFKRDF
ncbi:FkbM family methyltransferase [Roseivivax sp. GX 12232]|uniref:FkbM family methyltransferase n=1 Tax=Roseivivax sp. GX 12232 TaxID=2900547 RepID=UPI001E58B3BE|nr:FkbM family methyltransferase [Roseivivax sp. GX 12232]MCE0504527.1 FkbM family methyltransferase [Roseivivax sp. GX 12232]